ncbi:uncharacterized protein LOC144751130 [Ciona intestinalis]
MNFKVTFVIAVLLACVLTTSGYPNPTRFFPEPLPVDGFGTLPSGGNWSPWTKWNQQRKMENAMNDEMDAELLLSLFNEE